ncbi:MAG: AAA family ATPase [Clostridia bacterium]|nr:AAA family ATPase [Clostridia bacterium]
MGTGIIVCGLNGTGKSTLGKVLAERLNFHFIDSESLYFLTADPLYSYAYPRTHEEAAKLLFNEIKMYENFVFASVKGDYREWLYPCFQYAVLIDVPRDVRIQRVKNRSFQKFGNRMLPGGDLYEQEKNFFHRVQSRAENDVEEWLQSLSCPVIRVDGTKSIGENTNLIMEQIRL